MQRWGQSPFCASLGAGRDRRASRAHDGRRQRHIESGKSLAAAGRAQASRACLLGHGALEWPPAHDSKQGRLRRTPQGGRKGKLPTAFDVRDCRSYPQRKGSCKGDPLARKKQCQCLCETSGQGLARRWCRHTPRRRHECVKC